MAQPSFLSGYIAFFYFSAEPNLCEDRKKLLHMFAASKPHKVLLVPNYHEQPTVGKRVYCDMRQSDSHTDAHSFEVKIDDCNQRGCGGAFSDVKTTGSSIIINSIRYPLPAKRTAKAKPTIGPPASLQLSPFLTKAASQQNF